MMTYKELAVVDEAIEDCKTLWRKMAETGWNKAKTLNWLREKQPSRFARSFHANCPLCQAAIDLTGYGIGRCCVACPWPVISCLAICCQDPKSPYEDWRRTYAFHNVRPGDLKPLASKVYKLIKTFKPEDCRRSK